MRTVAAVLRQQGLPAPYRQSTPFVLEQVQLDGPKAGEVLVEVHAAGLCHSDYAQVAGLRKRRVPYVGGHEGAGIVLEVGSGVTDLRPGDHVVMTAASGCGHCSSCRHSRPVLCESIPYMRREGVLPNGAQRLALDDGPLFHYSGVSSFAQHAILVPNSLVKIDPSVPLEVAALFGCAVATGVGSVLNAARLRAGETVAVFGLGGVGLNAVMGARVGGASRIVGIDINDQRFLLARDLGCTDTLHAKDANLVAAIRELTNGGVDYVIEASGSPAALNTAHQVVRRGGEIICVGLGDANQMYEYNHASLVSEERVLRGSQLGSGNPQIDIPLYVEFFLQGRLPVDRLMSKPVGLDRINACLDAMGEGDARQVLLPHAIGA